MYPESVIFDFDGVIADTEPLHYKAFQEILAPLGLEFTWEKYCNTYMGFDDRDAFREAFNAGARPLPAEELDHLIQVKAGLFQKIVCGGVTAYPGVIELIEQLHTAKTPIALCSGALRSDIEPILEQLSICSRFSCMVTAEDVPHSKPDPASYRLAFQMLKERYPEASLSANRCCAIEDTPAGIASAKGAGLQVIAVLNSYPADKLLQADLVIRSLEELPEQFARLNPL